MDRTKELEDTFVKKFGVPVDSEVGLQKLIRAFCVMAQCKLDVEGVGFVKSVPPPIATPELQELMKLVEDHRSHGAAAQGTGGGQCEIPGRGKEENGGGAPAGQGRVAESPGAQCKTPIGPCQSAGPVRTAVAQRGTGPRVRVALPGQGEVHRCHVG